ncbi:MAG: hypothetical protein LUD72_01940, partial [Bacteroidales bacterium]|nr:hypothetical protein [Bacteroidales bacterium]
HRSRHRKKLPVKTSCKYINIKDAKTVRPFIKDCIHRHMSRYDFQKLLFRTGLSQEDYELARSGQKELLDPVIDRLADEAVERIAVRDLRLPPVCIEEKIDVSTHKVRLIGKESPWQQIFDCIAVDAAQEIWDRRIVPQQASSIKGRGQLYGTGMISKWIKSDNRATTYAKRHGVKYTRKCRYHVKIDVQQCYKSLRKEAFMKWFRKDCGNVDLVWLWDELLSSHRVPMSDGSMYEGFMIGARPSQTAAQYILSFIYRFAMDQHAKGRKLLSHALMFMDDTLLFSPSRKNLRKAVRLISDYALREFGLAVSCDWQIARLDDTPVDMMGFLVHADGNITVRPRVFVRARRLALRVMRRGWISFKQAQRACAYKGYFLPQKSPFGAFMKGLRSRKAAFRLRLVFLFRIAQRTVSIHERRRQYGYYCFI